MNISFNPGIQSYQNTNGFQPPSPEEAASKILSQFGTSKTDANGNQTTVLTKEQFADALNKLPKPPGMDLTQKNSTANTDNLFSKIDTNGDSKLDETELTKSMSDMQNKMQEMASSQGSHRPPDPSKFVTEGGVSKDELAQNILKDMQEHQPNGASDGNLLDRAKELASKLFTADANGDGKLTTDEVQSLKDQQPANASTGDSLADTSKFLNSSFGS
jgi:Ca2+-binding EF-hand superfamily protein